VTMASSAGSCDAPLALVFLAELDRRVAGAGLGRVVVVGGFVVELYSGGLIGLAT